MSSTYTSTIYGESLVPASLIETVRGQGYRIASPETGKPAQFVPLPSLPLPVFQQAALQ